MSEKVTDEDDSSESDVPEKVAIEGKLPLTAIDIESQKDMSSGGFHPLLSIHKWFAARPIPASRAAVLASVWPEEADHDELLKLMQIGPKGLNSGVSEHVKRKYSESRNGKSFEEHYGYANPATQSPTTAQLNKLHETVREGWGGELPTVLDPTSGRGIIPFESLRYGLPTKANELNPVAYLITKTGLEYASKIGSIKSEVMEYRDKIHQRAKENIQSYYPTKEEGREILNSAFTYILQCESCAGDMPLVRSWWINKSSGKDAIKPTYKDGEVKFEHIVIDGSEDFDPTEGTVSRGSAECPHCGVVKQTKEIREEIKNDNFEYRIYAVNYSDRRGNAKFRAGSEVDAQGLNKAAERVESDFDILDFLTEPITEGHNTSQIKRYGMDEWRDIFTPRQLITHYEYLQAFKKYEPEIRERYSKDKSEAILTLLGLFSSRVTEFNSRLAKWRIRYGTGSRIFPDNNLAIKFTSVDNNISAPRRGYMDWSDQVIEAYEELVEYLPEDSEDVETICGDAAKLSESWEEGSIDVAVVDPPYYSSIQYSELSDVFYTVLKRYLNDVHPSLFNSQLAEKDEEAVANPSRYEGVVGEDQSEKEMADDKYESKMKDIFSDVRNLLVDDGVITLMFTHREMDAWDTLATAFIESGFNITATHPIKTERSDRVGLQGKASADSSILLVGRRQETRKELSETLWNDVKGKIQSAAENEAKKTLDSEYDISKVDAIITAYGPVLQAYAEEYPVINKKGDRVRPRQALAEAREAVTEVIAERYLNTRGVDSLDSLTRWYILCWLIYETDTLPYDEANQLGVATGVDINEVKRPSKIWGKSQGKAQLKSHNDRVQDVVLLTDDSVDNPSSRKYPVDPTDTRFTYTIDAVHSAIHVYEREGARAAWDWLTERNIKSDDAFEVAITALLEVLPEDNDMYETLVNLISGETGEYLDINVDHIDMSGVDRQSSLGDHAE